MESEPRPGLREADCCATCFYFHAAHARRTTGGHSMCGITCAKTEPPIFVAPTMTCDAHVSREPLTDPQPPRRP